MTMLTQFMQYLFIFILFLFIPLLGLKISLNILYILNAKVWGPHYWFVLMTIAVSYPVKPNEITKKYYEFIQNLLLFIPSEKIGSKFAKLLDKYPVTPYLIPVKCSLDGYILFTIT